MALHVKPGTDWSAVLDRVTQRAPEAFGSDVLRNLIGGSWQAFKVGINKPRPRGDWEETFGGRGSSWRGCFVGGELLVQAVTQGPENELLYGNFPDHTRYPASI